MTKSATTVVPRMCSGPAHEHTQAALYTAQACAAPNPKADAQPAVRHRFLPKRYSGMVDAFMSIVKEEGILGLWTGVGPTVGRATALAAAELATYDEVKGQLKAKAGMTDGLPLTLCTAFASGYVSTVASSPFDVVSRTAARVGGAVCRKAPGLQLRPRHPHAP